MAKRTESAKKQARSGVRRAARNRAVRSEVKTMVVKARRSLTESSAGESERYATALEAVRGLDRAASKGVLHRNNAARRKSRLARQMAKLAVTAAAPAPAARSKKGTPAKAGSAGAGAAGSRGAAKPAAKPAAKVASKKK